MMKTKTWLPIALAIVLGVFAAILAKRGMSSRKAPPAGTVKLVVPQRSVAPGESLKAADLEIRAIAGDALPDGAFAEPSELVGRTAQAQLAKGKPVLESQLAPRGTPGGMQALVPPGMRAMTIEVNEYSSVGGMVTPGCRVDILSTMQDARRGENMSRTIAQNVLVKAVGQQTGNVNEKGEQEKAAKSVTLLVTSKQAEAIQLASLTGRPWLVLRGGSDHWVTALAGTTLAELRGGGSQSFTQSIFAALKNMRPPTVASQQPPQQQPQYVSAPSTQPAATHATSFLPPRSVHTIRATVERTVSVTPTPPTHVQHEAVTGTAIEP